MARNFLRNDLLVCAGVTALFCGLAFLLWPHAASSNPAQAVASPARNANAPAVPHKPSAYDEAFVPPPPPAATHPPAISSQPVSASDSAGARYPSVAPAVMAANLISAPPPSYPLLARIAHIHGQVTVKAVISRNGSVSDARAVDGHHLLRGAAEAAVRRRRYRPYRVDGQPANVSTVITVDFGAHS